MKCEGHPPTPMAGRTPCPTPLPTRSARRPPLGWVGQAIGNIVAPYMRQVIEPTPHCSLAIIWLIVLGAERWPILMDVVRKISWLRCVLGH